jgi:hypothetical protein
MREAKENQGKNASYCDAPARAHGECAYKYNSCDGREYVYQAGMANSVSSDKDSGEHILLM